MKKSKVSLVTLCALFIVFGMVHGASAIAVNITLGNPAGLPGLAGYGDQTSNNLIKDAIAAAIAGITPPVSTLYKAEAMDPVVESGSLSGSYATSYTPSTEPESVLIRYTGGNIVGPTAYLVAKDGAVPDNNIYTHSWYLYNLTALGWTGTEQITITGIWPEQGSFSHVELYGNNTPVPVPPSVWLLGSGLVGLVGLRRRFFRK